MSNTSNRNVTAESRRLTHGLASELLGPEGLASLRRGHWTFVALIDAPLGFIADLGAVFGPIALWGLSLAAIGVCLSALGILTRTRIARFCAYPAAVSLTLAVCFGIIVLGQQLDDASKQGLLAKNIAPFAQIQASLARIVTTTTATDERTKHMEAENAANFAKLERKIDALASANTRPSAIQQANEAVSSIAKGAAAGDPRLSEALDRLKAGDLKAATALLQSVADAKTAEIDRDKKDAAAAYRNLGAIAGLGDPARALSAYEKAVQLDPDDIESLLQLGSLQLDHGNLIEADQRLNQVLRLATSDGQAYYRIWAQFGLGDLSVARGNLPAALSSYRDASIAVDRLAKSDPGNAGWQRDLSVSYNKIGDVLVAQGNLPKALQSYRSGLAIADRLTKSDPGNAEWQRDLSVSDDNIGDVLVAQGNLPEALQFYRNGLAIADRLAKSDPGNAGWQRDLSVSYDRIGNVLVDQGNLPEALQSYRNGLAIADRLAKSDPGNADWQRDLVVSDDKIGDVLVAQGNLPEALQSYRNGLAIADRLAKSDPGNAGWQRDLSVSYNKIGDVLVDQGNLPEALQSYRNGLAIADRLAKSDPGNAQWQRDLSVSDDRIGKVLVAQRNLPKALQSYRSGLTIRDRLAKSDPGNAEWQRDLSVSHDEVGLVLSRAHDKLGARNEFRQAQTIMQRLTTLSPDNAVWKQDLAWDNAQLAALKH